MTIEELRQKFASIRSTLTSTQRERWEVMQAKFLKLESPLSPEEWVSQVSDFRDSEKLEGCWLRFLSLRSSNPAGWGENPSLEEVGGWSDDLPTLTKIDLIQRQISSDLRLVSAYEDWENR